MSCKEKKDLCDLALEGEGDTKKVDLGDGTLVEEEVYVDAIRYLFGDFLGMQKEVLISEWKSKNTRKYITDIVGEHYFRKVMNYSAEKNGIKPIYPMEP